MAKVIALSGWKRSGKNVAATYLNTKIKAIELSFACVLKDEVSRQYGFNREWCDNHYKEQALIQYPAITGDKYSKIFVKDVASELRFITGGGINPNEIDAYIKSAELGQLPINTQLYHTPRTLCIIEGQVKRAFEPNFWVNKVISKIDINSNNIYVISDVRFKTEIKELKNKFNGNLMTVRINRFDHNSSTNISETDLDKETLDVLLNNKGSFEDYYKEIDTKLISLVVDESILEEPIDKMLVPEFI